MNVESYSLENVVNIDNNFSCYQSMLVFDDSSIY